MRRVSKEGVPAAGAEIVNVRPAPAPAFPADAGPWERRAPGREDRNGKGHPRQPSASCADGWRRRLLRRVLERALERQAHVADGLHPLLRILVQAPPDGTSSKRRKAARQPRPVRLSREHRRQHLRHIVAGKGSRARQHLEEDDAEGPDVRARRRACRAPARAPCRRRCRESCPACVIAGVVMVGDIETLADIAPAGPSPSPARSRAPSPCRRRGP